MFFDILYNIFIYPIEFIIEILFYIFNNVFKSGYGVSLFFLSLCINFLSLPLYNIAESWQAKERAIQDKMKPMIDNIKSVYKGDQRYLLIRACQRINGYKTIYAFRGTLGLLIQIPFFIAAYNFIHSISGLNGQSFLFIKDLSQPDALIHIGNISINLLPFVMTLFSLLAGFVYARKLRFKESLPLYIVSLIFLVLLYTSPSGLLFYWSINCLFSLIKNIVIEFKLYEIFLKNKYKLLKAYNIFFIVITVVFILLISLARIERKAYLTNYNFVQYKDNLYFYYAEVKYYSKIFISGDIFEFKPSTHKLNDIIYNINFSGKNRISVSVNLLEKVENINENIDIYYYLTPRTYSINIFTFLLIVFIFVNFYNIYKFIFNKDLILFNFNKNRNKIFLLSSLSVTILSGLFIPLSIINSSASSFNEYINILVNTFSISIGIFLFYPYFIYLLFSERIKSYVSVLYIFISYILLLNALLVIGNYGYLNDDLIFNTTELLKYSFVDLLYNIAVIAFVSISIFFIIRKNGIFIINNLYIIIILSLILLSSFNMIKITKENKSLIVDNNYDKDIFNLSKNGENIFVFILDMAISSHWNDVLNRFPEYKEKLDGFIFYPNTVSLRNYTVTISSIYGGYDYYPYQLSTNGNYNIIDKHNESLLSIPMSLKEYGYKSSILDPTYVNMKDFSDLSIFKNYSNINAYNNTVLDNYVISKYIDDVEKYENNVIKLVYSKFLRLSIFRMLPIWLRYDFYSDKKWFIPYNRSSNINSSMYYYQMLLSTKEFTKINEDTNNYYNILHNIVTHEPQYFNSDFLPDYSTRELDIDDLSIYKDEYSTRHFYSSVGTLNCIVEFINFLKKNNVYDNTKIILVSDHGSYINTTSFKYTNMKFASRYNALLMFKDFNSRGNIKLDNNFMTVSDTAYLSVKHIPNIKNYFTKNIITNDIKSNGIYIVALNTPSISFQFNNSFNFDYVYYVKNNIFDIANWKKYKMDWNTKRINEIDFNDKSITGLELKN